MRIYEIVGKDLTTDGWETLEETKTLKQAVKIAKKYEKQYGCEWIDINLIIDNDLTETYDLNGKVR